MDRLKKARAPLRASLTKLATDVDQELVKDAPSRQFLQLKLEKANRLVRELSEIDVKILDALLDANCSDAEYSNEREGIEEYEDKADEVRFKINSKLEVRESRPSSPSGSVAASQKKRNFKLPEIELPRFNGELKAWLGFWSQFSKIHDDEEIDASDKFQYLIQATEKGSRAREVVESYPQSADNYSKAVTALQTRYGREELLVEVYVRELLKLVISNVGHAKEKIVLSQMYDKLEAHLRALETLGVTMEKYEAMLFPLVESSLPEAILVAWQRSTLPNRDVPVQALSQNRLTQLMAFLRSEVEGEERLSLARSGFGMTAKGKGSPNKKEVVDETMLPTAMGLFAGAGAGGGEQRPVCIFCGKGHESKDCFNAQTLTLQEKRTLLKGKRCCYVCFRTNHVVKYCKANVKCQVCNRRHYTIMCPTLPCHQDPNQGKSAEKVSKSDADPSPQTALANQSCTGEVVLQTLMVKLGGKTGTKLVRALIDTGSQRSYILKKTAEEMGSKSVSREHLVHVLFGGRTTEKRLHHRYNITLTHVNKPFSTEVEVLDQDVICGTIPKVGKGPWTEELEARGVQISDSGQGCADIEILLGADVFGRLLTGKIYHLNSGFTAIETCLGWTLMGGRPSLNQPHGIATLVTSMLVRDAQVSELWALETIGIADPVTVISKQEAEEVTWEHFLSTVSREADGRYQVSLPWITEMKPVFDTKDIAERRLLKVTEKLEVNGRLDDYQAVFSDWLHEGIIERVPDKEYAREAYYLPHRPVFKEESLTTQVRPVFDASCRGRTSPSLNDCLTKGINLLEQVPVNLLRFRKNPIGVTADIRKAFLMISVRTEDRDYLRFLWWGDYHRKDIQVFRHRRVVFGLNSSPFLLGAVLRYHLQQVPPAMKPVATHLLQSLYVDNCVTSVSSKEELERFINQSTALLADAKLELRMWQHSLEPPAIPEGEQSWVLGLKWDRKTDTLSCNVQQVNITKTLTKRSVLSLVQKIYDPLGFLAPVTLQPRLLLQEAWLQKVGWDQELSGNLYDKLTKWIEELSELSPFCVPRRATVGCPALWTLHTFCNASKVAYAAVVFLRCETDSGAVVQLLQAKARVAPLKRVTIPRLELLACTIGSRLAQFVREAMSLTNIVSYFWSDSTTALAWIQRNHEWGTFVGNRVREIRSLSDPGSWRHVPGLENPADLPSRGSGASHMMQSRWWEGPAFLRHGEKVWPTQDHPVDEETVRSEERKTPSLTLVSKTQPPSWYMRRDLSYTRILRVLAWVRRFLWNARTDNPRRGELTGEEILSSERILLRQVQREVFTNTDNLHGLQVETDKDGLIRVKSKLIMLNDVYDFRYPILLPARHPLVEAIIKEMHLSNCHAGINVLLARLRERYWILRSRQTVKRVLFKCVRCRRHESKAVTTEAAPLPVDRIRTAAIFEIIGIDLAGPLYLRDRTKVWIVLYTCAVYRAVHLELVRSLSTECFLQSFRRYVARRGRPVVIYCDNGTNFRGAYNLFRCLDWKEIGNHFAGQGIQWKFSPPSAAWWGGWWERIIRMVKDLLVRVLGKSTLTYDDLLTLICEAEATLNSRPLTYVSEETDELIPLTPSMFLQELRESGLPEIDVLEATGFQKRFRYRQRIREQLQARFRQEYLSLLVQRTKEHGIHRKLKVGDIVLVECSDKKRLEWPMARITKLIEGQDGNVRVAQVKTALGTLLRPLRKLYPLEVMLEDAVDLKIKTERKHRRKDTRGAKQQATVTRSGRLVKPPVRLGV